MRTQACTREPELRGVPGEASSEHGVGEREMQGWREGSRWRDEEAATDHSRAHALGSRLKCWAAGKARATSLRAGTHRDPQGPRRSRRRSSCRPCRASRQGANRPRNASASEWALDPAGSAARVAPRKRERRVAARAFVAVGKRLGVARTFSARGGRGAGEEPRWLFFGAILEPEWTFGQKCEREGTPQAARRGLSRWECEHHKFRRFHFGQVWRGPGRGATDCTAAHAHK